MDARIPLSVPARRGDDFGAGLEALDPRPDRPVPDDGRDLGHISPWTQRDLARQGLFDIKAIAAFVYLLVFAMLALLTQVSQYNLSAKRFRANHAPGWAGVWPLAAFAAGAAFWAQPNLFGLMPAFAPWLFLLTALAAFAVEFCDSGACARTERGLTTRHMTPAPAWP